MNKREQELITFKKQPMTEEEKAMMDKFKESKQECGKIKELRQTTGMNQSEFAEYFGVPVRTLQEWEQERRTPPHYVVELMERVWKSES